MSHFPELYFYCFGMQINFILISGTLLPFDQFLHTMLVETVQLINNVL